MKNRPVLALSVIIFFFTACTNNYTSTDYLREVLNNLNKIESVTYNSIGENWNPGDTAASQINYSFVKEYNNPSDTTIGAKFVMLNQNGFEYRFLLSTKEVLKSYSINSFPVFFILDENRVIRNVINGYGKGSTDSEIITAINELID